MLGPPLVDCRLDKLILDAIAKLKEPRGSDRAAIAMYIEVLLIFLSFIFSETSYKRTIITKDDNYSVIQKHGTYQNLI